MIFFTLSCAAAYILKVEAAATAVYLCLIIAVLSWLSTAISVKMLKFYDSISAKHAIKGENLRYRLKVVNRAFFPFYRAYAYFSADDMCEDFVIPFSVNSRKSAVIEDYFNCRVKGDFRVGVTKFVFYDPLGLFKFTKKNNRRHFTEVFPAPRELTGFPVVVFDADAGVTAVSLEEDPSVVSDLREYLPSDPPRKIHWKASAKKNEWIVKNFQSLSKNTAYVAVQNTSEKFRDNPHRLAFEDAIAEAAVSAIAFLREENFAAAICYCETRTDSSFGCEPKIQRADDYSELFSIAAKLPTITGYDAKKGLCALLDHIYDSAEERANIIIVYLEQDKSVLTRITKLIERGHNVIAYTNTAKIGVEGVNLWKMV